MADEPTKQQNDASETNDIVGFDFDGDTDIPDVLEFGSEDGKADEGESEVSPEGGTEAEGATEQESVEAEPGEAEGEPTEEGIPAPEGEGEAEDQGPFLLGDREYASWEDAEQAFRSALGQQSKVEELQAQNQELIAALTARAQGTEEPETTEPEPPAEEKKEPLKLEDVVDPKVYEHLLDSPGVGAQGALAYMLEGFGKVLADRDERHKAETAEALKPALESVEQSKEFNDYAELFTNVGRKVDKEGNMLYPEIMEDASFVEAVAKRMMAVPGLADAGEMGVYLALLAEREWRRLSGQSTPDASEEETEDEGSDLTASEASNNADQEVPESEVLVDGGDTPLPSRAISDEDKLRGRLSRELIDHEERIDPVVGFDF